MENGNCVKTCNDSIARKLWYGVVLIGLGIVWMCINGGAIAPEWKSVIISWQMLLVVMGIGELLAAHLTAGSILVIVGLFFGIGRLSAVYPELAFTDFAKDYWPLLLILLGVITVIRTALRRKEYTFHQYTSMETDSEGRVNVEEVFNGSKHIYTDDVFRGGRLKATFGGSELDLRNTRLPEQGDVVLNVEVAFGGVEIYVPADWTVIIKSQSVFGGFTDKRFKTVAPSSQARLVIIANCAFGGGEIKF